MHYYTYLSTEMNIIIVCSMICPLSGDTPCQDKVEHFSSQFFLSHLCRILTELKTIQPFFEGRPPTPTKEQSKVNEGLNFGQFVQVRVSRSNCN